LDLRNRPRIGIMGPSACSPRVWNLARDVGYWVARLGGILICGGGGGVMEAAAKGAKDAGGVTVGILPGNRSDAANAYIDIPVVTDLGNARNVINVLTSQVVIAVHGGFGTLSEIALALKCGTSVVGLETWALSPPPGESMPPIRTAANAQEAVTMAFDLLGERSPTGQ
jgi:uncharacterized protein (TIGR00725 family)